MKVTECNNCFEVYFDSETGKYMLYYDSSPQSKERSKERTQFIRNIGNDDIVFTTSRPPRSRPLCSIVLYEETMVVNSYDNKRVRHASKGPFRSFDYFSQHLFLQYKKPVYPIIHIFHMKDTTTIEARFYRIADSSIWNHILCWPYRTDISSNERDLINQNTRSSLLETLGSIRDNRDYYNLAIAHEYVELNARLATQSYISFGYGNLRTIMLKKSTDAGDGHGDKISPFLFHSERKMKEELNERRELKTVKNYKWHFLLVDDKIDKTKEAGILTSSDHESRITKRDILEDRIRKIFEIPGLPGSGLTCKTIFCNNILQCPDCISDLTRDENSDILITCVEDVKTALSLMKEHEFDIILLDYLLTKNQDGKQEYGYDLLIDLDRKAGEGKEEERMNKLREAGYQIGPQGKFFFMFISAFTTAVSERLNVEGLSRNEDIWEIGEGACPTNTPELFKYRLVHLMKRRLDQTGISDLSKEEILDTISTIFAKEDQQKDNREGRIQSVRKRAFETYHKVLGYHYDYTLLRKYDKEKSRLVDSFLKEQVHMGAMLEHLLQLVHLVAFGTMRQWPEIWEEYKFFERTINLGEKNSKLSDTLSTISKNIEDYIIDLKSDNHE